MQHGQDSRLKNWNVDLEMKVVRSCDGDGTNPEVTVGGGNKPLVSS